MFPTYVPSEHYESVYQTWERATREFCEREGSAYTAPRFWDLRELTLRITDRFDPLTHHFVGVGRSPTPIMAILEALYPETTTHLPFGNLSFATMSANFWPNRTAVVDHFHRFLPSAAGLAGRSLVLIDYTHSGRSLAFAAACVKLHYFQNVNILTAGFVGSSHSAKPDALIRGDSLDEMFAGQYFDEYAKYERWTPGILSRGREQAYIPKELADWKKLADPIKCAIEGEQSIYQLTQQGE